MLVSQTKPTLLIEEYSTLDDFEKIKKKIITNNYSSMSQNVPMCRFRGTVIDSPQKDGNVEKIMGWQRSVSRIRKMDVSLQTLISLTVNETEEIVDIELDDSFRGSKGLLCSQTYLDKALKRNIIGLKLNTNFLKSVTMADLHCFHLVEILSAIYSYYRIVKHQKTTTGNQEKYHFEEEVMDCFLKDDDGYAFSKYVFKDREPIWHTLKFNDLFRTVGFDKAGNLKGLEKVKIDFFINDTFICNNTELLGRSKNIYRDFLAFILKCINEIKIRICDDLNVRFLNTNLFPGALIGSIVQAVAMQTFKNNYNYVMHVLTALQRPDNTPLCLGAIKNKAEAETYFEGYDFEDLLP